MISLMLCGLAWWSTRVESSFIQAKAEGTVATEQRFARQMNRRIELIETLDRIVAYEHYYHSVYGHFTKILNRVGFKISRSVTDSYDIRVAEASTERLLITALSEVDGKVLDIVSIDQDYQMHANFEVPAPRMDYLKSIALKHLRFMKEAPSGQVIAEQGVFKGFFQYISKNDSRDQKVVVAVGVRPPVVGVQVELSPESTQGSDLDFEDNMSEVSKVDEWLPKGMSKSMAKLGQTGQVPAESGSNLEEEAFLAQKIFLGEVGRYAKTWKELEKIAHFRFEGKDQYADGPVPYGGEEENLSSATISRTPAKDQTTPRLRRKFSAPSGQALEIEPILSDDIQSIQ